MQAVGMTQDGRKVIRLTGDEARKIIEQRLVKGLRPRAPISARKTVNVRELVASLERGIPGEQAGV
jgi:hypothetical protein